MLSVQDEQHFNGADQLRMRVVLGLDDAVQHAQEVIDISLSPIRQVEVTPDSMPVSSCGNRGGSAKKPLNLKVLDEVVRVNVLLREESRVLLWLESRHRTDRAHEHPHRMSVVVETLHHGGDVSVDVSVVHNRPLPLSQLGSCWEFSINQQEGDFQESGLLSQLFNRVAAIFQNAFISIDEGDARGACDRVGVAWVIIHQRIPLIILDLSQVFSADEGLVDRDLVSLSVSIVSD
mmetsp:Transcript_29326/g.52492  ORF Transcript_29326/g.52492 Transcript_29326/m.52492 type:complete len:234 (-) Transcript_29326:55-756(-)